MPARPSPQALFVRWLWLVYLPLAGLLIGLPLLALGVLSGPLVWLLGLLAAYCVVPVRLLLETRRQGLQLPRPPQRGRLLRPASARRPPPAAAAEAPETSVRVRRPGPSPQIRRRRAVAALIGIGILGLLGGLLFILGMGQASSGRAGLVLIGAGVFLMILSVTLPTFKIVDTVLRAVGRLLARSRARGSTRPTAPR